MDFEYFFERLETTKQYQDIDIKDILIEANSINGSKLPPIANFSAKFKEDYQKIKIAFEEDLEEFVEYAKERIEPSTPVEPYTDSVEKVPIIYINNIVTELEKYPEIPQTTIIEIKNSFSSLKIQSVDDVLNTAQNAISKVQDIVDLPGQIINNVTNMINNTVNQVNNVIAQAENIKNQVSNALNSLSDLGKKINIIGSNSKKSGGVQKGTTTSEKVNEKIEQNEKLAKRNVKKSDWPSGVQEQVKKLEDKAQKTNQFMLNVRDKITQVSNAVMNGIAAAMAPITDLMNKINNIKNQVQDIANQVMNIIGMDIPALIQIPSFNGSNQAQINAAEAHNQDVLERREALDQLMSCKNRIAERLNRLNENFGIHLEKFSKHKKEVLDNGEELSDDIIQADRGLKEIGYLVSSDGLATVYPDLSIISQQIVKDYLLAIFDAAGDAQAEAKQSANSGGGSGFGLDAIAGMVGKISAFLEQKVKVSEEDDKERAEKVTDERATEHEEKALEPDDVRIG